MTTFVRYLSTSNVYKQARMSLNSGLPWRNQEKLLCSLCLNISILTLAPLSRFTQRNVNALKENVCLLQR